MQKFSQQWFEMSDVIDKDLSRSVWIPLRVSHQMSDEGDLGYVGHSGEFYGATSLLVPVEQRDAALKLGWAGLNLGGDNLGWCDEGRYIPSDKFENGGVDGTYLVLQNGRVPSKETDWYLHQDLVLTLGLIRKGNAWVRPADAFEVVASIEYTEKGSPSILKIRTTYLKDYLCARNCGLLINSFRSRHEICKSADHINWKNGEKTLEKENLKWNGYVSAIHDGGFSYGGGMAHIHVSRTDADPNDDVPSMDGPPTNDNTTGSTRHFQHPGEKVYKINGELWKEEWVSPGNLSPIVRDDKIESDALFIVDGEGKKENADKFQDRGIWLWFKPEVINNVLLIPESELIWSTRDTGSIQCCGSTTAFGINSDGFVNVFAEDVWLLPHKLQNLWSGFNTSITGKICEELFQAQARGEFLDTLAPEKFIIPSLERIRSFSVKNLEIDIVVEHYALENIANKCHRFRSIDEDGFLSLAKDLARLSADSFIPSKIGKLVSLGKEGSLKALEKLLASKIGDDAAHKLIGPLFHIYDLRLSDAHLPKEEVDALVTRLGISATHPWPIKGYFLLKAYVDVLWSIGSVFKNWS